jgi:hypothetical protein
MSRHVFWQIPTFKKKPAAILLKYEKMGGKVKTG